MTTRNSGDTAKTKLSLIELISSLGMKIEAVADHLDISRHNLYQGHYLRGRVTQSEIDKLAEVLRVDRELVVNALRENERRYEAQRAMPIPKTG